jgi:hypothetical protein
VKHLERGAYELERVILLYDWCERYDAWGPVGFAPSARAYTGKRGRLASNDCRLVRTT